MFPETIHRLSSQRAVNKLCAIILAIGILLAGALDGVGKVSLLWIAAPLLVLGLADAGYAAQQRRCVELLKKAKGYEDAAAFSPEAVGVSITRFCSALLSLSIWPFYLSLLGIVVAGAFYMPVKVSPTPTVPAAVMGPMGNMPGQPYWPMPNGSMYPPYMQQARPPMSPFPSRQPGNPINPHVIPPGLQQPATPVTRYVNPNFPKPASPVPGASIPSSPAPEKKQP